MPVVMDVNEMTRSGSEALGRDDLDNALRLFKQAFRSAKHQRNVAVQLVCAFNLGAVHIARREPDRGLEMLHQAVPPVDQLTSGSCGDLYYNFGLGYELKADKKEAVKYFELALEEYRRANESAAVQAELANRIASLYAALNIPLQAARSHRVAACVYGGAGECERQLEQLCKQTTQLLRAGKGRASCEVASECMVVCQKVNEGPKLGDVYNELGLVYSQCRDFASAATCFELALPLSRAGQDKTRQAVVLQNLGATCNSLGEYKRGVGMHKAAAALYVELGNRKAQGECFTNLAFAYTLLRDYDRAGESYLHALQAAKDIGDKHDQWQSMEGLAAIAIHEGRHGRAVRYFQAAITTLAASGERNDKAQKRLVAKLTDALQRQLVTGRATAGVAAQATAGVAAQATAGVADTARNGAEFNMEDEEIVAMVANEIYVNGAPRPPTALEEMEGRKTRREHKMQQRRIEKMRSEFERVALGVGGYDCESDLSVSRVSSLDRVQRRKSRSSSVAGHHAVDGRRLEQVARTTFSEADGIQRQAQRRRSVKKRRKQHPLLRHSTFNSEVYWETKMKDALGSSSLSDEEYRVRLHPPSTDDDDDDVDTDSGERRGRLSHQQRRSARSAGNRLRHSPSPVPARHSPHRSYASEIESSSEANRHVLQYVDLLTLTENEARARDEERSRSPKKDGPASGGDLEVTTPNVLVTTYEKPVGSPEKSLPSGPDPSAGCSPKTGKDEASLVDPGESLAHATIDMDDPIYQSIRSNTGELQAPSKPPAQESSTTPPPLPKRQSQGQFHNLSRAQQEVFLKNFHQNCLTEKEAILVPVPLPPSREKSSMCVII